MFVRVLLLWPGTTGAAAGNFGVPQLVGLASYLAARTRAKVDIRDLVCERALGRVELPKLFTTEEGAPYDVIGISCYSSYDFLIAEVLANEARRASPGAVIVAGGYHVSARPRDFVYEGSPFDVAVIGEGEKGLEKVVASVVGGEPLRGVVLESDPILDLDSLPETDWSLLERYRGVARKVASQTQIYLSRGCPFDCSFCMERAKRETSWRAYSVPRALAELEGLNRFLGLQDWTLYIADALFGMRKRWREEFFEGLKLAAVRTKKTWFLIRVDMVDESDLLHFRDCNASPGFGLESGDPGMLRVIRKAGRLDDYLERMSFISRRARELDVPWGANIIVGHPGETEVSMRRSAEVMSKLFLRKEGTTGFLSVDPFRLYPGSPVDDEREAYSARYGTVFHRPEWWKDGDQEFLSEWIDPSRELSYARRSELMFELFAPVVRGIRPNFTYQGAARDYFLRAIDDQVSQTSARHRLHFSAVHYAWMKYTGNGSLATSRLATDGALASVARELRTAMLAKNPNIGVISPELQRALVDVPRERFVPLDRIEESVKDVAIALDDTGLATVSAPHAYAHTFTLANICRGMKVLDLGAGSGYGTALLLELVGGEGFVRSIEIDPKLVARAKEQLGDRLNVDIRAGSALDRAVVGDGHFAVAVVGFEVEEIPAAWLSLADLVVAPVKMEDGTWLVRAQIVGGKKVEERHLQVRYVPMRH